VTNDTMHTRARDHESHGDIEPIVLIPVSAHTHDLYTRTRTPGPQEERRRALSLNTPMRSMLRACTSQPEYGRDGVTTAASPHQGRC